MSSKEQARGNDKASAQRLSRQPQAPVAGMPAQRRAHPAAIIQRAGLDPKSLSPRDVLQLQRTIGNRAVGQFLASMGPRPPAIRRAAPEEEEVQAKPLAATITPLVRQQAGVQEVRSEPLVQRKIEHEFQGHVGFFAGIFKAHDRAFQRILSKYKLYQKAKSLTDQDQRLVGIVNECRSYLDTYRGNNPRKDQDAEDLLEACQTELDSIPRQQAERNPLLTKKTGGTGKLNKGATLYMDAELAQEFKYTLETLDCEIAGDYATQGAYLVRVWSVQAGKIIAWVKKADVASVTDPQKIESRPDLRYEPVDPKAALFPHDPTLGDVQQGGLGDCYLLAAVLTVVNRDPDLIRSMMADNGDTVTVHLYDVKPGQPRTFVRRDVTIDKSIVMTSSNQEGYARTSLWVQMLEKAYAAAGYTGLDTAPLGSLPSYGDIGCGLATVALEHLLGKPGEMSMQDIQTGIGVNVDLRPKGVTRLPWSEDEKAAHKLAATAKDKHSAYAGLVAYEILSDTDQVDAWMSAIEKVNVEQEAIDIASKGDKTYKGAELRLGDFARLFAVKGIDQGIAGKVVAWLADRQLYPGKRGTGRYTGHQLELFGKIKSALDGEGYAVVASKLVVARGKPTGTGHSGGEAKAKGLVGGHAYAVLEYGYGPKHSSAEDPKNPRQLRWVKLRNPWGSYGREYDEKDGKLKAKEAQSAPETWLELSDLTKRYAWIETVQG